MAARYEGTGIGLALVHELVKLHGGEITVASEVGRGTAFTVAIPLGIAHLPADQVVPPPAAKLLPAARRRPSSKRRCAGYRRTTNAPPDDVLVAESAASRSSGAAHILVADDNADMREYVTPTAVGTMARRDRERWRGSACGPREGVRRMSSSPT